MNTYNLDSIGLVTGSTWVAECHGAKPMEPRCHIWATVEVRKPKHQTHTWEYLVGGKSQAAFATQKSSVTQLSIGNDGNANRENPNRARVPRAYAWWALGQSSAIDCSWCWHCEENWRSPPVWGKNVIKCGMKYDHMYCLNHSWTVGTIPATSHLSSAPKNFKGVLNLTTTSHY